MAYPDDNPKTLYGVKKVPLHLVPPIARVAESLAFADGARKYGPYNWRYQQVSASIYIAAAQRHIELWWDGEERCPISGVHHLGHARACMAILLDAQACMALNDDRPPASDLPRVLNEAQRFLESLGEADLSTDPGGDQNAITNRL